MKGPRHFWPWALLGVPALGVFELVAHLYFRGRTPQLEDYRALEPVVRELRQAGDLVVISPDWAEPNLRWALGDGLMPLRDVARPEDSRYPVAVEVRLPGTDSTFGEWKVETAREVGAFVVERRVNPRHEPVLFDFVDAFSKNLSVSVGRDAHNRTACTYNASARVTNGALGGHATFPAQRFECGNSEWDFVGVTVIEDQTYHPRRCLWAHPPSGKRHKVIQYDQVPLGKRITGFTGAPFLIDRETDGAPIEVLVTVDGEQVGQTRHENGDGWRAFDVATDRFAGGVHRVAFEVFADSAKKRDFCFHADVR